jgi:hypothetical protein
MKFNFRKIASTAASVAMVGSTVALAAAVSWPGPFVDGGAANVAVVYGANADLGAVTEITSSLSAALADQSSGGSGTPEGGDFVLLSKPSDELNLNNTLSGVFGTTVDDDDLADLLGPGVYENDENTEYDFDQKLTLGSGLQVNFFADSDYEDKDPTVGVNMSGTHVVLNYTLNFIDQPESDVSGGDLVDFETTDLPILGRNYFVLDADNATNFKFTLLDAANTGLVSEGETVNLVAGSTTYEVSIVFIGSSEVKLDINGVVTNSLAEGGTQKLPDGSYVGIKDILVQDYSGGIKRVEFSIGTGKLELTGGSQVKLNDDTVNEITSYITKGTGASGGKERVSNIILEWKTDDDSFITGESELVMPGFEAIKFTANDFFREEEELTVVKNKGSDVMELTFESPKDGRITVPFLFANSSGEFENLSHTNMDSIAPIGESATELVLTSLTLAGLQFNDTVHDYLIASWNNTRDAESYVLRFSGFRQTDGINYTTTEKLTDSGWDSACGEKSDSGGTSPTCDVGSLSLTLNSINSKSSTGGKYVNFTGNAGSAFHVLYTAGGLEIMMPYADYVTATEDGAINATDNATAHPAGHSSDTFFLFVTEEDKDGNLGLGARVNVTVNDQSDGDIEISSTSSPGAEQHKSLEDDDNLVGMVESDLATEFWRYGSSTAQRHAELIYAGEQSYFEVFLSAPDVTTGGGVLGTVQVMDDELAGSGMQTKNLLIVGGSCVNSAAASVLDVPSPTCGAGWTSATGSGAGEWLIQSFANPWSSDKVATLVAGYEQGDTANGAEALTTQDNVDIAVGQKYTGGTDLVAVPSIN